MSHRIKNPQNLQRCNSTHLFNFSCKLIQKCPRHSLTYSLMCGARKLYELHVKVVVKTSFLSHFFFVLLLFPLLDKMTAKPLKMPKMIFYCVVCFMWENESTAVQIILLVYYMNELECILFALVFPLQFESIYFKCSRSEVHVLRVIVFPWSIQVCAECQRWTKNCLHVGLSVSAGKKCFFLVMIKRERENPSIRTFCLHWWFTCFSNSYGPWIDSLVVFVYYSTKLMRIFYILTGSWSLFDFARISLCPKHQEEENKSLLYTRTHTHKNTTFKRSDRHERDLFFVLWGKKRIL